MNLSRKLTALGVFCALTAATVAQTTTERIKTYFQQNYAEHDLTKEDCDEFVVKNEHDSEQFGLTFAYAHQQYEGITIHNAIATFVLTDDMIILSGMRWEKDIQSRANSTSPSIDAKEAILAAAQELNIIETADIELVRSENHMGNTVYTSDLVSREEIPAELCFTLDGNALKLAWNISIRSPKDTHWWSIRVDAQTGEILNKNDWMLTCSFGEAGCSEVSHQHELAPQPQTTMMMPPPPPSTDQYNVFALPAESPNHAAPSLVVGPSDPVASPFGWHDDDGVAGEEYTITRGNNVYASEDTNDDDQPGYSPDGGANLDFNFPVNLNQPANGFWDPAITNLFYMNNMMHDVLYHYGFDEASGNFQENNYGNGGAQSDMVNADAQDGSGTNNANFGTPPDGGNPRMQMYIWTAGGTPTLLEINSPVGLSGQYLGQDASIGPPLTTPITADFALFDDGTGDTADACEDAINGASLVGKIVVIRRGGCTFADKIVRAETEGALAVIMVNNQGGLSQIGGTDPGIGIPSIMVQSSIGEDLITELENGGTINGTLGYFGPFDRDSDLDNGIIAHEYGHGVSNRLTGGGSSADCLWNDEQMGEGWSDYLSLIFTMEPGDQAADARGIGTYADGQPTNGVGIRPAPYSTDFSVNNYTYGSTNNSVSISQPHGIGFIWCTMLWDLTWAMIDVHGFDADLHNGTGGNNMALNLVMTGMKIQPCSPGFVDGRDAILAADQMLYGGEHECLIWEVFAKRGLGYSADQGSSFDRTDQTGAFDLPPGIDHTTNMEISCAEYVWPVNGQTYTTTGTYYAPITPTIGCDSVATLNLTVNNSINSVVTYDGPTTLVCTVDNVNYQWLSCSGGVQTEVPGATGQSFSPTSNGLYAVVAYEGNCIDTSVCIFVNQVAISEVDLTNVNVYPNPTNGDITIDLGSTEYAQVNARIVNAIGQLISETTSEATNELHMNIKGAPGIYFVHLEADGKSTILKVVKD